MRHYEVMIVLQPEMGEDGFNKHLERVKKSLESGGGKIVRDDRWGLRTLAYEIKKQTQGYYTVIEWEGPPELIAELDHSLRLDENVLRHLVIHLDQVALEAQEELRQRRASGVDQEERRLDMDEDEDEDEDEYELDEDEAVESTVEDVAETEEVAVPEAGEEEAAEEEVR